MANTRELKKRMVSVKETRKITQAMKMVAAAKFKRALKKMHDTRRYFDKLQVMLEDMASRMDLAQTPSLFQESQAELELVMVITGDRGLCGGFNTQVIKTAESYLKSASHPIELVVFGNKGFSYFKSKTWPIKEKHVHVVDNLDLQATSPIVQSIVARFDNGEIGRVRVICNQFKTALASELINKVIVPIAVAPKKTELEAKSDLIYDPSLETALSFFLEQYLMTTLYAVLIDSKAGEEGARMAAMDAATDNAEEMLRKLTLLYNQSRQAAITKEISEIVGGAEALSQ